MQNSFYAQVLRSPIFPALLQGTRVAAFRQTLWRGTRNGIAELSQRAPPIFGWALGTLGIGPHSSMIFSISTCYMPRYVSPLTCVEGSSFRTYLPRTGVADIMSGGRSVRVSRSLHVSVR